VALSDPMHHRIDAQDDCDGRLTWRHLQQAVRVCAVRCGESLSGSSRGAGAGTRGLTKWWCCGGLEATEVRPSRNIENASMGHVDGAGRELYTGTLRQVCTKTTPGFGRVGAGMPKLLQARRYRNSVPGRAKREHSCWFGRRGPRS